ncbi:MAG: hypothetical protein KME19_21925 [Microcoleus vaginatus WJT46-NPBG5]|jgi:NADPH:quinone reductase-like Zn-dependent oxidoreductase|nr:hypothetical protein [Microcoleus vaginatus WJT46-NPBG5]
MKAFLVTQTDTNKYETTLVEKDLNELPAKDVLIHIYYSCLNYKDAL